MGLWIRRNERSESYTRRVHAVTGTPFACSSPMRSAGTSQGRRITPAITEDAKRSSLCSRSWLGSQEGHFSLNLTFLNSVDHSAVLVRWSAEREGMRSEGNEIAVYRFSDGKIAQVWFYVDGYDPEAFSAVFAFD
jgi:hypothetical protein